jgi:peptidoglycan hydrolase-like protein with peptidoglycan-binding domain
MMTMYRRVLRLLVVLVLGSAAMLSTSVPAGADPVDGRAGVNTVYPCTVVWNGSGLFTTQGYSSTWTRNTKFGDTTFHTVEIQCLLQFLTTVRAGMLWPGPADRSFGPMTEAAVRRAQQVCKISDDGQVGTNTWPCLRRTIYLGRPDPV